MSVRYLIVWPYAPAIVTLDEGYQMFTHIVNATPRQLRLNLPVGVTFVEVSGELVVPYFEPVKPGTERRQETDR